MVFELTVCVVIRSRLVNRVARLLLRLGLVKVSRVVVVPSSMTLCIGFPILLSMFCMTDVPRVVLLFSRLLCEVGVRFRLVGPRAAGRIWRLVTS